MYIEPNTTIKILKNVPLDPTYDHTIWFQNKTNQSNYFLGKEKYNLDRQTYQRVQRGWMRVNIQSENLYDCNYLMFKNTAFGSKWFYAFIKSVEYINNTVSEIEFELDVMQTWMFDYEVERCFVLREHSLTDNIGDNLVPENVNTGIYVTGYPHTTNYFTDWKIVIISTGKIEGVLPLPEDAHFYGGVAGCMNYTVLPATESGLSSLHTILHNLSIFSNTEMIANIIMMPSQMIPPVSDNVYDSINGSRLALPIYAPPFSATSNVFGGYVPKNKKLYTYPYNYFTVSNQQGQTKEFMYEQFDNTVGTKFSMWCDGSVNPSVICVPMGYLQKRQTGTEITENFNDSINISNFPKCTWATTDLGAKLMQGTIGLALTAMTMTSGSFYDPGTLAVTPPIDVGGFDPSRALPQANELMVQPHNYTPPIANGRPGQSYNFNGLPVSDAMIAGYIGRSVLNSHVTPSVGQGNTVYIGGGFDFQFRQVFIDEQFARCIDDYFNAFGYATNRLKIPNIGTRPHWNYVRTANCTVKGSVPADDITKICSIYNHGITFWKNGDEVGNYYLDNSPV